MESPKLETATLAGGCFWCTEAVFKRLRGVTNVISGYTGGTTPNPHYEDVVSENSGHAEAIQIIFDPSVITYDQLLDVFWATHDPTTINRQGYDAGLQYRSEIFYHDELQKNAALSSKETLEKAHTYPDPIVTKIEPYQAFYPAEQYHKDYYDQNRTAPYCMLIIDPKIKKLLEKFSDKVKEEYKD